MRSKLALVLLVALLFAQLGTTGQAEDVENLDADLEALLLEDLKDALPPDALKQESSAGERAASNDAETEKVGEDLGEAAENPLARIGQQMRSVETRIAGDQPPQETREMQEKIVADLEALIKQAQQQQKQQKSGGSKGAPSSQRSDIKQPKSGSQSKTGAGQTNSKKPARDSTSRLGTAEAAAAERQQMQDRIKDLWGHLPERA
ncbi:MAG: hypothetical protein KDA42_13050, partial [Planctomycetales bacterium]|nr:hypothetical protein [Planctomycetales bacterium]